MLFKYWKICFLLLLLLPLRWLRRGSHVTMTLFGLELPLHRLLLAREDLIGEIDGDTALSTSIDNFPGQTWRVSLGIIFNSPGVGNGDLSDLLSPKYGQVHGGGKGYEELSAGGSTFLDGSLVTVWFDIKWDSWKLAPRLLHRGEGVSSRVSPSWKVEARLRCSCHWDGSLMSRDDCESAKLSTLRSSEL